MAELQRVCIEGLCGDVPTYTAGNHITIEGIDPKIISADLSDYYTAQEVNDIVSAIEVGGYEIVDTLPETGRPMIIYLVPRQAGGYERWIYSNDTWIDLGDTDTIYTAGNFITISDANVISATDMRLKDANNDTVITAQYSGSAVDADYIAGWNNYKIVAMNKATRSTAANNSENSRIASTAFVQSAINNRFQQAIYRSVSNRSIPNATNTKIELWTAPNAGIVIGIVNVVWAINATGSRFIQCVRDNDSIGSLQCAAAPNGRTRLQATFANNISAGQKLYADVYQASGGALTAETIGLTIVLIRSDL